MRVAGLLLLCTLLIPSGPVTAQGAGDMVPPPALSLSVDLSNATALTPEANAHTIEVDWQYMFPSQAQAAAAAAYGATTIHWEPPPACDSPGIIISGPSITMVPFSGPSTQYSFSGSTAFHVAASRDAPGLQVIRCDFSAYAEEAGPSVPASNLAVLPISVTVAFHGSVEATTPAPHLMASPDAPMIFQVEIRSTSNAKAIVEIEAVDLAKGWTVTAPRRIVLEPGAQRQVDVIVHTPDGQLWTDSREDIALRLTPIAELDESRQGEPSTLALVAESRGIDVVSPSGGLALLGLVAAAGLLGWARLRRKETQQ